MDNATQTRIHRIVLSTLLELGVPDAKFSFLRHCGGVNRLVRNTLADHAPSSDPLGSLVQTADACVRTL